MRITRMSLILACLSLALASASRAESAAEELFRQGKWNEAAEAFRKEIDGDTGTRTLYNFGTALAKSGALPEAYAVLLKAYYRNPLDGDVSHNLTFVERKLGSAVNSARPASWFGWWPEFLRGVNPVGWLLLALIALAPGLWWAGSGEKSWRTYCSLGTAALLVAGAPLAGWQSRFPIGAVITPTKMRSGPESSFQELATLAPGSLLSIEETRDRWHKIRFVNANSQEAVGWVESPAVLRVLP